MRKENSEPRWPRWTVVGLAGVGGIWMLFDGLRALTMGDYTTPSSGPYAGQLGPWADLVQAADIDPRSTFMKSVFVTLGAVGLLSANLLFFRFVPGLYGVVAFAVLTLWYLPFGTLASLIQLVLLGVYWKSFLAAGPEPLLDRPPAWQEREEALR